MKTKHLFFATALVASLAACTNEDFVGVQQEVAQQNRLEAGNVQINFMDGAESRLTYNGNYAWEGTDTIGALLMDTYVAGGATWVAKYPLVNYIQTSYPFTYANGNWGTPGKMLEGNYFFTYPWVDFSGSRAAAYAIDAQHQNGVAGKVVAENFAKNQIFVGYSQIEAGEGAKLTKVEMTRLLGAVQLRIKNNGTKAVHINKVVLRGNQVKTGLTLDPTTAEYKGTGSQVYHYENSGAKWFNYANYMGDEEATGIYTIPEEYAEGAIEYSKADAARSIVDYTPDAAGTNFVQLFVDGAKEDRAVAAGETGYALVMLNPYAYATYNKTTKEWTANATAELVLDIYTDEGLIGGIDLTAIQEEVKNKPGKVLTDDFVHSTVPGVANTINVIFNDESIVMDNAMDIYTETDLMQLITWNLNVAPEEGEETFEVNATLKDDVELNAEMFEALKSNSAMVLNIKNATSENHVLTLDAELPANVLDYENLVIATAVEAEGEIVFTKETQDISAITALEGASFSVNVLGANVPASVTIEEGATMTVGADAATAVGVVYNNEGVMTVAQGGKVQGTVNNAGTLTINGQVNTLNNTTVVNMGAAASINGGSNNGTADEPAYIYTAQNVTIKNVANGAYGRIKYEATATIQVASGSTGKIFAEIGTATLAYTTYKDTNVNLFILKSGKVTISEPLTLSNVEVAEGAISEISVNNFTAANAAGATTFVISNLKVVEGGSLTTVGAITLGTTKIEEDAEWSNNGTISLSGKITNNGLVYNNNIVTETATTNSTGVNYTTTPEASLVNNWKINGIVAYDPDSALTKQNTMNAAVTAWLKDRQVNASTGFYAGNPYDVNGFINTLNNWKDYGTTGFPTLTTALSNFNKKWITTNTASDTYEEVLKDEDVAVTEFTTAVTTYLTGVSNGTISGNTLAKSLFIDAETGAFKSTINLIRETGAFETQTKAYDAIRLQLAKSSGDVNYVKTAWTLTDSEIEAALAKTTNGKFLTVWTGTDMDKLAKIWKNYSDLIVDQEAAALTTGIVTTNAYETLTTTATGAQIVAWAVAVKDMQPAAGSSLKGITKEAQEALADFTYLNLVEANYNYVATQIDALLKLEE